MKKIYKGYTINIEHDDDPTSPREDDNLGTIVGRPGRDSLVNETSEKIPWEEFASMKEVKDYIINKYDTAVILPVYMYSHSGVTINTTGYSCMFDSWHTGFIFVSKEKVIKEYGAINMESIDKAARLLESEIKTYDRYLQGDIYGFQITKPCVCEKCGHDEPENIDSCWGYYGEEECLKEAKSVVDGLVEKDNEKETI